MPALVRNASPRGPRFYEDAGRLMFVNILDASTRDGPRPATAEDKKAHAATFAAFKAGEPDAFPGSQPLVTFSDPPKAA